jgi:hypothetical protein
MIPRAAFQIAGAGTQLDDADQPVLAFHTFQGGERLAPDRQRPITVAT